MKATSFFWGSFLIALGLFFLLNNVGAGLSIDNILMFWPVLLILWGISFLKMPQVLKNTIASGSGILAALLVISVFNFDWIECNWRDRSDYHSHDSYIHSHSDEQEFEKHNIALAENTEFAAFNFEGGAGEFNFGGFTEDLVSIDMIKGIGDIDHYYQKSKNKAIVDFTFGSGKFWNNIENKRTANIKLNSKPIWDIDIEAGACKLNVDLSKYNVRYVNLSSGAADIDLKFGSIADDCQVKVETGAANVEILVPEDVNCEIFSETGLSSEDFFGFERHETGKYFSKSNTETDKTLRLNIEAGLSSVTVKKY